MSPLPGSPAGPLWKEMLVSRAFSTYPSRSPVKEPPSRSPSQCARIERCPVSRALPGELTPPHISQRGPYGKKCPSPEPAAPGRRAPGFTAGPPRRVMSVPRALLPISFRIHSKEAPLQVSLTEFPQREIFPFRIPLSLSPKIPSKRTPTLGFPKGPPRKETPVSRTVFYPSPSNSPFPQCPR